ncbi:MAG TPA: hypothetical protein VGR31_13080 [Planctomycetota bacterium]|jgi:hypothetical protein|nr:hypothetical protein [Planctomycetota bacterium]
MSRRLGLGLAAFAIVAILIGLWLVVPAGRGARSVGVSETSAAPTGAALEGDLAIAPPAVAEARSTAVAREIPAPAATSPNRIAEGQVVDLLAAPAPDVPVFFEPSEPDEAWTGAPAKSDAAGRFQLEVPNRRGSLRTVPGSWTSVFEPRIEASGPAPGCVLVVARTRSISGRVVDAQGAPLADAQVRFELPGSTSWIPKKEPRLGPDNDIRLALLVLGRMTPDNEIRSEFPLDLGGCGTARWIVASDARGAFAIPNAPRVPGAQLVTLLEGYDTNFKSPYAEPPDLLIVLRPPVAPKNHVIGRVVDVDGSPVPNASVFFGLLDRRTDQDGGFDLDVGNHAESAPLVAVKEGWLPVSQPCLARTPVEVGAWPDPLVLVLRERALVIRGHVVDATGIALPQCRVLAIDPVGLDETLQRSLIALPGGVPRKNIVMGGSEVPSGPDGSFELAGLLPRRYRLRAVDLRTLGSVDTEPIEAGRVDLVIRVETGEVRPCVAGQVVDSAGRSVASIRVQTGRLFSDRLRWCEEVRTDADGHFNFPAVSRQADRVAVLPDGAPRAFRFSDFQDPCAMRLVAPRTGDLRVELTTAGLAANEFAVLDRTGARMQVGKHWGSGGWRGPMDAIRLESGKSGWVIVPDDAALIILLKDGTEVARQAVEVKPGELNVVRL